MIRNGGVVPLIPHHDSLRRGRDRGAPAPQVAWASPSRTPPITPAAAASRWRAPAMIMKDLWRY